MELILHDTAMASIMQNAKNSYTEWEFCMIHSWA